jgi:hypothetical protein
MNRIDFTSNAVLRGNRSMPVNAEATWAGRTAKAMLLIRILVGWVFLSEGIQKFLSSYSPMRSESGVL